jgi:hypothetical protein
MIAGSFLALSAVLLLAALVVPASASHFGYQENTFKAKIPPKGSVYAIDIDGSAKIAGKAAVKPVSANIELKVVQTKSTGVPTIYFELVKGEFSLGDDVYTLEKGNTVIQTNKVNIKATSKDGTQILTIYAALAGSLPIKTTENPAKLVSGQDTKSASIQVLADKWILKFGGIIERTA